MDDDDSSHNDSINSHIELAEDEQEDNDDQSEVDNCEPIDSFVNFIATGVGVAPDNSSDNSSFPRYQ